jgi:hypothetical protein
MIEQLDPEDLKVWIQRCFDHASKTITHGGGTHLLPTWSAVFLSKRGNRIYHVVPEPRIKSDSMSDAAAILKTKALS